MKFLPRSLCALLAFSATDALFSATSPIQLVGENSPLVVSIHDFPELLKNWPDSPWARTWNDPQVRRFFAPMRTQMKIDQWDERAKAETGYTVDELLALATGDAVVALTSLDFVLEDPNTSNPPVMIAIEFGANASKVETLLINAQKKSSGGKDDQTEEFAGVTLHTETKPDGAHVFSWAIADGLFVGSPSKDTLTLALDALKRGGAPDSLGRSERYLRMKERAADANLLYVINVQSMYPTFQRLIAAKSAEKPNPMVDMNNLLPALGVDAIKDLFFGVALNSASTEAGGGLTYSEKRGLIKMLAYKDGPAPRPAYVSPRWLTVNSAKFSFREFYAALEETLDAISPVVSGMAQGQIKNYNRQLGIDIKRDFVGSIGDEMVSGYVPKPGASASSPALLTDMDQFIGVSLTNAEAFSGCIEAFKGMMGPAADKMIVKREYLGQTINTFAPPQQAGAPQARGFSYVITKSHLFLSIGSASAIETALQGLSGKQPSLWDLPAVKQALIDSPSTASTLSYQDTGALMGSVFETIATFGPMMGNKSTPAAKQGEVEESKPHELPFDVTAKPDPAVIAKYWGVASGYGLQASDGIFFKSRLDHKK